MGGNSSRYCLPLWTLPDPEAEAARAEAEAEKAAAPQRRAAEADALGHLAETRCPPDIVEFGRRHGIPTFAEVTWNNGFQMGWAAAFSRRPAPLSESELIADLERRLAAAESREADLRRERNALVVAMAGLVVGDGEGAAARPAPIGEAV